jgi:choline transport protein
VLFCLPGFYPATPTNMNYVSVVVAGVIAIILIMWYAGKRNTFVGPQISIEGLEVVATIQAEERKGSIMSKA